MALLFVGCWIFTNLFIANMLFSLSFIYLLLQIKRKGIIIPWLLLIFVASNQPQIILDPILNRTMKIIVAISPQIPLSPCHHLPILDQILEGLFIMINYG